MKIWTVIFFKWVAVLAFCWSVSMMFGQTAKVVVLTHEETTEAKSLNDQKQEIEKKMDAFNEKIRIKYVAFMACNQYYVYKNGWQSGFVYDETFRFIVTKTETDTLHDFFSVSHATSCPVLTIDGNTQHLTDAIAGYSDKK